METMKKTEQYLSIELIIQILLMLPVKSLIRFKCVCKLWFSLISQSDFANSHFQLTAKTHAPRILLITPNLESLSIDLETSLYDDSASYSLNINFLLPQSFTQLDIKGSCRGFILLSCGSCLCLWNPSTGVHKYIPNSLIDCNLDAYHLYGFGYDESRDDYFVLSMSYDPNAYDKLTRLGLFSLRADAWNEIEGDNYFSYCLARENSKVEPFLNGAIHFLNGAIHWLALCYDISTNVILGYHLMQRELLELTLPADITSAPSKVYDLWVFRGCLSLWDMAHDNGTVEIWVMEKYNVTSSWTKTLVLSFDGIPSHYFCPKYDTKSGDIVGTNAGNVLAKYNEKGQLLEHQSYCDNEYGSLVVMYTESLLSIPDGDSGQAKKMKRIRRTRS
ncbi:putative F-box domain-containing protein [Medicago truncatula]|uniref:F-box protein interaction domain protein n=1 Tax=Medicago truncatula TaxID=3880 RepID=G7K6D7_MEDTR|nr:F-box/kelch-repeat protein At3g23880 [Medicago truncatula]AES98575.2 F-box protein interaction domain protein [Medicago truncatula]RHN56461.1 putative F-box domain-containing protein [Medicago truncatula]